MAENSAAHYMARALRLAERGRYTTHPNPRVGCVMVKNGRVLAEGWHERAGGPHAEVMALRAAGAEAKGADVYVTLEPCCHHGRTPPCTEALIAAGVRKVYSAMEDPHWQVAGKGAAALQAAGIAVETGLMRAEAERLNRGFVLRMTQGRPWITLKLAMSLDGRTAMANGESRWITSEEARADVHRLRATTGAVLTSVETVLADNPALTIRLPPPISRPPWRQPDRIVLDTRLRTPPDAEVWREGARRLLLTVRPRADRAEALRAQGVEVLLVGLATTGHVDLVAALKALGQHEINEVLVESGPRLAGAFLQAGLVDELVIYTAPSLLGHEARGLAELPGLDTLEQRIKLRFEDVRMVGADLKITARPVKG